MMKKAGEAHDFTASLFKDFTVLTLCFMCFMLTSPAWPGDGDARYHTVIDDAGRSVTVREDAHLIVLITSQEIFRLLGVENRVVAVHRWVLALHPEENPVMAQKPIVGGFSRGDVNYEKIIEIASRTKGDDLVVTYAAPWAENVEEKLDSSSGIKVIKLNFDNMDRFDSRINIIAEIVGKEKELEKYRKWSDEILKLVADRLKHVTEKQKPVVFWDSSAKGNYGTGNEKKASAGVIRLAGGINAGNGLPLTHNEVSPEWLLEKNPDIFLSQDNNMFHLVGRRLGYGENDYNGMAEALEKLGRVPGIKNTKASKNGKIYFIQDDLMSGPKSAVGVLQLAKWFYPDRFKDIKPEIFHKEYYERFMRLPFKGIHVYPEY